MMQANNFELSNSTTTVNYSASSLDGRPQLSYKKGNFSKLYRGEELRQHETEIGMMVSVTLKKTVDSGWTVLSLFVPRVNVTEGRPRVALKTLAIEATVRTSIGGPNLVSGAVQTYKSVPLKGHASAVLF